jgi:hypothetical protein
MYIIELVPNYLCFSVSKIYCFFLFFAKKYFLPVWELGEKYFREKIFKIRKGKCANYCSCSGKPPLRNGNSGLKNGEYFMFFILSQRR